MTIDASYDSLELKLRALLGDAMPVPAAPRQMIGEVVGGTYEVLREIGAGGMGQVYVARHARTRGEVALKLIRSSRVDDEESIQRFEREAMQTAGLNHPNIVKVFDYGHDDGLAYIAMELVAGGSLGDLLVEQGVVPPADAMAIAANTLLALDVAHAAGLVHRDIKPDNILVARDGGDWFVKVVDFGIAHAFEDAIDAHGVVGSPHTMAPEQFTPGGEITPRADLYALGCTVYGMLTGVPPFAGSFWELAVFHAEQRPPPLLDVSEALADWVMWLMAKSPRDRPSSARVALEALRAIERGERSVSPTPVAHETLPRATTSFIGRAAELDALDALHADNARLITLVGIGGLGKTRLSIEWVRSRARAFPGGAYFCDLAEVRTIEGICIALAQTLGAAVSDGDPVETLGSVLRGRGRAVVVLDNFEQIVGHAPDTLGRWLGSAPDVSFVVTSRQRVGLGQERLVEVAPLATSEPGSDGVQLFIERATQARPEFAPDADTIETIRALVEQLDGLPLAIEMAAARVRSMSPANILSRLGERFRLLRSSRRDISARQLTLRAALDWSWDLLDPAEQAALRQCAVFAGSFSADAVDEVLDLSEYGDPWLVDVLESLVDKSLVRVVSDDRYGMFVSVRDYALEKLEASNDALGATLRHLEHYSKLGTLENLPRINRSREGLDVLERDLENLRAAAVSSATVKNPDAAVRCAVALVEYFHRRGPYSAGIEIGERVLAATGDSIEKCRLLSGVGLVYVRVGDLKKVVESQEAALEMARRIADPGSEARSMVRVGFAYLWSKRGAEAVQALMAGGRMAQELGDAHTEALSRFFIGIAVANSGDLPKGLAHLEFALSTAIHLGEKSLEGWVRRMIVGVVQIERGSSVAFEHARRSLEISAELGTASAEAWSLHTMGTALAHAGDLNAAVAHYRACLPKAREVGDDNLVSHLLEDCAYILIALGHPDASSSVAECLRESQHVGEERLMSGLLADSSMRLSEGRLVEAKQSVERVIELATAVGREQWFATALFIKAQILGETESPARAVDAYGEALASAEHAGLPQLRIAILIDLARTYLSAEQPDEALATIVEARSMMASIEASALLRLEDLCVRADILRTHGRASEADQLVTQAQLLRDELSLLPDARLYKMVEEIGRTSRASADALS